MLSKRVISKDFRESRGKSKKIWKNHEIQFKQKIYCFWSISDNVNLTNSKKQFSLFEKRHLSVFWKTQSQCYEIIEFKKFKIWIILRWVVLEICFDSFDGDLSADNSEITGVYWAQLLDYFWAVLSRFFSISCQIVEK